jgi:hypothetical protein
MDAHRPAVVYLFVNLNMLYQLHSFSPCVQTGSGDHPASYPVGTGGPFPGGKARLGRDADHSPPI